MSTFQPAQFSDSSVSRTAAATENDSIPRYTPSMTPVGPTPAADTPMFETPSSDVPNGTPNDSIKDETPVSKGTPLSSNSDSFYPKDTPNSTPLLSPAETPSRVPPKLDSESDSDTFERRLFLGKTVQSSPALDDMGYDDPSLFDVATNEDIEMNFASNRRPLFYCNGKIFKSALGAMKQAAIAYPESSIYKLSVIPFNTHVHQRTRLPRVAHEMSKFFDNMSSEEIFESMKRHVSFTPTRNPFNSPNTCAWTKINDFFGVAVATTSVNMASLLEHKRVLVTSRYDMANACWAAQARSKLERFSDNEKHFWALFEQIIQERFTKYTPENGMVDKMANFKEWSKNLWMTLIQSTDTRRYARKMRHVAEKRKREEMEQNDEEEMTPVEANT